MRLSVLIFLGLSALPFSGCQGLNPNSKLNPNRGEYHDEWTEASKEGRSDQETEKPVDSMGSWIYSPKARAIFHSLGTDDY